MIELIEELPGNVVGIVARGRGPMKSADTVLAPGDGTLAEAARQGAALLRDRLSFSRRRLGGDLDVAIDHLPQWERIAIVHRQRLGAPDGQCAAILLASEVRVFTTLERAEGRAWIASLPGAESEDAAGGGYCAGSSTAAASAAAAPPRSRRPSVRPARRGGLDQYRHPSADGR